MKITVLLENSTCREDLTCEHGLSLYIETGDHRILFDAGQTDAFARNAEILGIDLTAVDLAVLSHGHYDHGGGLPEFLRVNDHAKIYVNREAFTPCYDGQSDYIGLNRELLKSRRLVYVDDVLELAPGVTLHACNSYPKYRSIDSAGLTVLEGERYLPDSFRHEQYLLIEENGKRICVSGCSHKGIENIVTWLKPDVLIGGFHFMKLDPDRDGQRLTAAAEKLLEEETVYYTGHCTGDGPYAFLKDIMGDRLNRLSTGVQFEV